MAQHLSGSDTTLNFGPWYRRSPFFDATLRAGCSAFDVYQPDASAFTNLLTCRDLTCIN